MLRISKLTDYATVILSHFAKENTQMHSALGVAEATGITLPTVSKILKILVNAKLVVSARGAKGGYVLAQTADKISIADVISAMEGPIALTECSMTHEACDQVSTCGISGNWGLINTAIQSALAAITLADMIKPSHIPHEFFIPVSSLQRS